MRRTVTEEEKAMLEAKIRLCFKSMSGVRFSDLLGVIAESYTEMRGKKHDG